MAKNLRGHGNVPNENHDGSRSFRPYRKPHRRKVPKALFAHSLDDIEKDQDPVEKVVVKQTKESIKTQSILERNNKLALVISATHSVGFLTPIWVIFGTDRLGLSLLASLILGSTGWVSSAIFEIPMGAFADKFGRQFSLIVGLGCCAIADLSLVVFKNFWLLILFQIISGIGFSMRSGSLEGLLHDTFEASGVRTAYAKLSSNMLFLANASRILTVPIGAWLYQLNPSSNPSSYTYPYIANALCTVVALSCAMALVEKRSSEKVPEHLSDTDKSTVFYKLFGHIGVTWNAMIINRDVVRIVLMFGLYAVIGEGNWALYQYYFRDRGLSTSATGWIYAVLVGCMAVGAHYVAHIYKRINVMWSMNAIIGLVTLGVAWMHLPLVLAIPAFLLNALMGPMCLYLQDNAVQNRMPGDLKTTALSISNMSYNIGSFVGIFGIGAIAQHFGVLHAQWVFVVYGLVVFAVMGYLCLPDGYRIRPEDARATNVEHIVGINDEIPGAGLAEQSSLKP